MKKLFSFLAVLFLLIGCATPQQQLRATEGDLLKTSKTRAAVMDALVGLLIEEGYAVDNINEKYGIVSCQPLDILTGQLMTKLGEPGGGFVGTNSALKHSIKFNAHITETGDVRIKATALNVEDDNIFTTMVNYNNSRRSEKVDTFRTIKLNEYYSKKLLERLTVIRVKDGVTP